MRRTAPSPSSLLTPSNKLTLPAQHRISYWHTLRPRRPSFRFLAMNRPLSSLPTYGGVSSRAGPEYKVSCLQNRGRNGLLLCRLWTRGRALLPLCSCSCARKGPELLALSVLIPQLRARPLTLHALQYRPKHLLVLLLLLPLFYIFSSSSSSAIPFHHPLGPPTGNSSFSPTPARQIPPYLHYVFGLSPTFGGKPFGFIQYLCFSSALGMLKPEVIYMHHVYPPTGWWWEQWKKEVEKTSTRLEMIKERDVQTVFGREVDHFAHKADVLRLEALRDYGGVYLDTDVIVIRGELT